jgi:TonB family protein
MMYPSTRKAVLLFAVTSVLTLCSSSLSSPASGQTSKRESAEWVSYAVGDGEFSVLLPVVPGMSTYDVRRDPSKNPLRHLIGAYWQGEVYGIYVFERKKVNLDDFIDNFGPLNKGDFTSEINVKGIPGKEYSRRDDKGGLVSRFFMTAQHVYVFQAAYSALSSNDTGRKKFFDSISFDTRPIGNPIIDGPGEPLLLDSRAESNVQEGAVLNGKDVTIKARVITKPEPTYTEEARRNQVTGTVVLKGVFSSSGSLANITVVNSLPDGLTEKAIGAAKQIKFIPPIKDGRFVSMYIQLEYNFNLY